MLDQSKVPGLRRLVQALGNALDHSGKDPAYLAKSALELCIAHNIGEHSELIAEGLACAREYWSGRGSEIERERLQISLFDQYGLEQAQHGKDSREAACYALAVWSVDSITPSDGFAADYLLDAAIRAGFSVDEVRVALERNIPALGSYFSTE